MSIRLALLSVAVAVGLGGTVSATPLLPAAASEAVRAETGVELAQWWWWRPYRRHRHHWRRHRHRHHYRHHRHRRHVGSRDAAVGAERAPAESPGASAAPSPAGEPRRSGRWVDPGQAR